MEPAGWHLRLVVLGLAALPLSVDSAASTPALTMLVEQDGITLEVTDATRREALEELFHQRGVVLQWHDAAAAQEVIRDRASGSLETIARRLLQRCNYLIVYDSTAGQPQIAQVHIYGLAHRAAGGVAPASNEMPRRAPTAMRADATHESPMPAWKLAPGSPDPRKKGLP